MKKSIFIFIFIFVAIILFTSGVSSETLYYKEYKYGSIRLEWNGVIYTLTTKETNINGFLDICIIKFKEDDFFAEEVLYVTERNTTEGHYKIFFDKACKEGDLKLINCQSYFKDKNLCYEYEYELL